MSLAPVDIAMRVSSVSRDWGNIPHLSSIICLISSLWWIQQLSMTTMLRLCGYRLSFGAWHKVNMLTFRDFSYERRTTWSRMKEVNFSMFPEPSKISRAGKIEYFCPHAKAALITHTFPTAAPPRLHSPVWSSTPVSSENTNWFASYSPMSAIYLFMFPSDLLC